MHAYILVYCPPNVYILLHWSTKKITSQVRYLNLRPTYKRKLNFEILMNIRTSFQSFALITEKKKIYIRLHSSARHITWQKQAWKCLNHTFYTLLNIILEILVFRSWPCCNVLRPPNTFHYSIILCKP